MNPPARILAVTDLSPASDIGIADAAARARAANARLGVVHAVPALEMVRPLFPQRLNEDIVLASQLPARAEETIRRRLASLNASDAEVLVESGGTAEVALRAIETWRPDLVVVGAADDGALDGERIVRHAPVPAVIARKSPATRRVIVGTDFSDPALPAIRAAASEAVRLGGELLVVHAIELRTVTYGYDLTASPAMPPIEEVRQATESRLREALAELSITAESVAMIGSASTSLVDLAAQREAELLVTGTHGRTGLTRFLIGSVAESVTRRAPCSVLVVRLA